MFVDFYTSAYIFRMSYQSAGKNITQVDDEYDDE